MTVRIVHVEAREVSRYADGLRALEEQITYPLDDGQERFFIDHGSDYAAFFEQMGEAHFLVALNGAQVVGAMTGVLKRAELSGRSYSAGYACDLKLDPRFRGAGLAQRMLFFGLKEMLKPSNGRYRSWRMLYAAAMRDARGDVRNSAKGLSPIRLVKPWATLGIYFVQPEVLAMLPTGSAPALHAGEALNLSPDVSASVVCTAGRKDLRLVSTGAPWPLHHLVKSPAQWGPDLGGYLSKSAQDLLGQGAQGMACFALDHRLKPHINWLLSHNIQQGAVCTVLGMFKPSRVARRVARSAWLHLATSEI